MNALSSSETRVDVCSSWFMIAVSSDTCVGLAADPAAGPVAGPGDYIVGSSSIHLHNNALLFKFLLTWLIDFSLSNLFRVNLKLVVTKKEPSQSLLQDNFSNSDLLYSRDNRHKKISFQLSA